MLGFQHQHQYCRIMLLQYYCGPSHAHHSSLVSLGCPILRSTSDNIDRCSKYILLVGLCIGNLGLGLRLHTSLRGNPDAELVMTQILFSVRVCVVIGYEVQGLIPRMHQIGGTFAGSCTRVGSQASVPHAVRPVSQACHRICSQSYTGPGYGHCAAGYDVQPWQCHR